MLNKVKAIDTFSLDVAVVFLGTTLASFFNLLFQLLIAHRLNPSDFAAFNSLLSLFFIISMSMGTVQIALAKYIAEFNAHGQDKKIRFLLTRLLKKASIFSLAMLFIFYLASFYITKSLKIDTVTPVYILAVLVAFSCVAPVLFGGIQGLELFGWLTSAQIIPSIVKLILGFLFILLGFNISGALGALLVANLMMLIISYAPLKKIISGSDTEKVSLKEFFIFIFPVAVSTFCFFTLVSSDMVLVKYFFSKENAGVYSIAQMTGKIFLFFPWALSMVMLPKVARQKAKKIDTASTLRKSLYYAVILCAIGLVGYNAFPSLVSRILTGKATPDSIFLGRLFSVSMSFFTLLYILVSYFISINELRFIKYLVFFALIQALEIFLFHKSLAQIQIILCINAMLLFFIHLVLFWRIGRNEKYS